MDRETRLELLKSEIQQIQVVGMRDQASAHARFERIVDAIPDGAVLWTTLAAAQRDQLSAARTQLADRIDELVAKESVLAQHIVERAEV